MTPAVAWDQGAAIAFVVVGLAGLLGVAAGAVGLFVLRVEYTAKVSADGKRIDTLEQRIHELESAR